MTRLFLTGVLVFLVLCLPGCEQIKNKLTAAKTGCDPAREFCDEPSKEATDPHALRPSLDKITAPKATPRPRKVTPPRSPRGRGGLRMTLTLGSGPNPFSHVAPWTLRDLPGYNSLAGAGLEDPTSPVVIMLCETDDPTCKKPVLLRQLTKKERGVDPHKNRPALIQSRYGPEVTLQGLPEGDFLFMVFMDSHGSRSVGYGWDSPQSRREEAWGGVVSEGDLMRSAIPSRSTINPPAEPLLVSLRAGKTQDLGTLTLSHIHQREISPKPPKDQGTIVVAGLEGLRRIDVQTYRLRKGNKGYQSVLRDSAGSTLKGSICGLVDGPGDLIYILYKGVKQAGFAVPFDVKTGKQLDAGHRVFFPGIGSPCRGIYHHTPHGDFLFVTNAESGRGPDQDASEGFWGAALARLSTQDVMAIHHNRTQDPLFSLGVDDMVAHGLRLYFSVSPGSNDRAGIPEATRNQHSLFQARFGPQGHVTWDRAGDGLPLGVPVFPVGAQSPDPAGNKFAHPVQPTRWASLTKARFHDGRMLMFMGGFLSLATFEIPDLKRLKAGKSDLLKGHWHGANFTSFALSPGKTLLWAIPQDASGASFYLQLGADPTQRQTFNRYMAMAIDLQQGNAPGLSQAFAQRDLDGWKGKTNIGDNVTPAKDPGLDLGYAYYMRYQVRWAPNTRGSTFGSAAFPINPAAVSTGRALWLRGAGTQTAPEGPSGLGKGGDLGVFDFASQRAVLFPQPGEPFYGFWSGGAFGTPTFGFDLTPERDGSLVTRGMIYKP